MKLNPEILHNQLTRALKYSTAWRGYKKHSAAENSYRSAYFCYQVGTSLNQIICDLWAPSQVKKRQVCFDENDEKATGEWLLDIVWSEDYSPNDALECSIPKKLFCAVECESSTVTNEFFVDFAKLVNVASPIKIFLAGLNQKTSGGAESYQKMRLDQAAQYIAASKSASEGTEWYIGFWPSPKTKEGASLWDSFSEYPHLNVIHLYQYMDSMFVRL